MQTTVKSNRTICGITAGMAIVVILFGLNNPTAARTQTAGDAPQSQSASPTSFEVASIKPSAPAPNGMFAIKIGASPGGRWTASGITVGMLIQQAYDVRDYQISGAPNWLNSERYDIVAKADTPNITREMAKVLLQSLLAERMKLQIHRETKELPIYNLVVGKNGHKLHVSETQPAGLTEAQPPDPAQTAQKGRGGAAGANVSVGPGGKMIDGQAPVKGGSVMRMGRGQLSAQMTPVSAIAAMLAQQLSRPVIDKTDLKGNFDFSLQWTPDETQRGIGFGGIERPPGDSPMPADPSGPSIFTAIQEQLGLKLESSKGPVEILVIDHVERPSGN